MPQNIPLSIIFEDADMLAVNKPPGMVVQFARGALENAVAFHCNATGYARWKSDEWPWKSDDSFEGIVHRLDKGTSGLMVVAKHPAAARALSAAFRERRVSKTYLAVAVGLPSNPLQISTPAAPAPPAPPTPSAPLVPPAMARDTTAAQEQGNGFSAAPQADDTRAPYGPTSRSTDPRQKELVKAIRSCGRDVEKAKGLLYEAEGLDGDEPSAACYSAVVDVCVRGNQREAALGVLESMRARGVTPSVPCFQAAIGLCAREPPLWRSAVELLQSMKECGLGPDPHCVSSAISACGRAGELSVALELLDDHETTRDDQSEDSGERRRAAALDDGAFMMLRAAIRACEREGAVDKASVLASRLQAASGGGHGRSGRVPGGEQAEWGIGSVGVAIEVDAPIGKLDSR